MRNGLLISYWWLAGPLRGAPVAPSGEYSPVHPPPSPSLLANVIGFTLVDQRKPCRPPYKLITITSSLGWVIWEDSKASLWSNGRKNPLVFKCCIRQFILVFSLSTFYHSGLGLGLNSGLRTGFIVYILSILRQRVTMSLMIKGHTFLVTLSL